MIGINFINTNKFKTYNANKTCLYKKPSRDTICFSGKIIRFNMGIREEVNNLKQNKYMKNSLVAFIPEVLENYFNGNVSKNELADTFTLNMNKTKFYLSQMPEQLLKENQQAFKNEFAFADKINKILKTNEDERQLYKKLSESIKEYLNSYQEDACGR